MVDPVERFVRASRRSCGANETHRGDLGVCQVGRRARNGKANGRKLNREGARVPIEEPGERKKIPGHEVSASKSRDIARQPQAKTIIENAPVCGENGFGSDGPGEAEPRSKVIFVGEPTIVIPPQ